MAYCWLKKRGKIWYLHYSKGLGLRPESLRTSDKSLAKETQRRRESELYLLGRGEIPAQREPVTYSAAVRRFLEHKAACVRERKTLHDYERMLNTFGEFLKSDVLLGQITLEKLEEYVVRRRTAPSRNRRERLNGKPVGAKTLHNELRTLKDLFHWAEDRGYIAANPARRLKMPKRVKYDTRRALTMEEVATLRGAVAKMDNPVFADAVDLALCTGARRRELVELTSDNFDFDKEILTVRQFKQGDTKPVPIGAELRELALRMIAREGEHKPLVSIHYDKLSTLFAEARKAAGLPENVGFHCLRHTFISWLFALGTDIKTVQDLAGHRNIQSTMIYAHSFNENRRAAIEKLSLPKARVA